MRFLEKSQRNWMSCGIFMVEQKFFAIEPAAKAHELAIRADHAMARDDDRDRVLPAGSSDCARQRAIANRRGDFAVGAGLAEWDQGELVPDVSLEPVAIHLKREVKRCSLPGEVLVELTRDRFETARRSHRPARPR